MAPYILFYSMSLFFCFFYQKTKGTKVSKAIILVLVLLPLIAMSYGADISIGKDKLLYGIQAFDFAKGQNSFIYYRNLMSIEQPKIEIGYLLFNYLISKLTNDFRVYCLIYSVVTNFLMFKSFGLFKEKINITFAWFAYLFIYFPISFGVFRQSLAISLAFFGISLIETEREKIGFVFLAVSYFFHSSALFVIVIYLLILLMKKVSIPVSRLEVYIIVLILVTLLLLNILPEFLKLIDKYSSYIGYTKFSLFSIPWYTVFSLIYIKINKKTIKLSESSGRIKFLSLAPIFIFIGTSFSLEFQRLNFYLLPFVILILSSKENKIAYKAIYFSSIFCIFAYFIILLFANSGINGYAIYPYTSNLFGF